MPSADLVLKNANVVTMDPAQPHAELVAAKGDRILFVGRNADFDLVKGNRTRVIDCQGKTVVPGFNDAHCHIFSYLRKLLSIDLSPQYVRSISDIKGLIKAKADTTPSGQWISGTDYNEFYLSEKRHPSRREIDEVAPNHPVVLSHRSLHACVLNSRALALAGITHETPEPSGALIERDPNGEPTGLLFDMLGHIRQNVMPPFLQDELEKSVYLANQHYLSQGITSLQDATVTNDLSRWQKLKRFKDESRLKSRVYMMFGHRAISDFKNEGLSFGDGDASLRLGGVKFILTEPRGQIYPSQPELDEMVFSAHRAGFPVAAHAFSPAHVEAAITAFENARKRLPGIKSRHRIEHCAECPSDFLERLKASQAVVVTQPPFVYYSGERYLATIPAAQVEWLYRFRLFLRNGIIAAASSDSPLVPDNPLMGIYAAVTRQTQAGQYLVPDESISAGEALAMYTINAAYASHEEGIKGSLTSGKLADMVILSADLMQIAPEEIKDITMGMTILGGEVVWEG
ncbi:MAG: amidohydrolase [Chloroflexi bacterium]|nr:amidohydrolase [Chloroflexota bacterium]